MTIQDLINLLLTAPDKSQAIRIFHTGEDEVFDFTKDLDTSSGETAYLEIE